MEPMDIVDNGSVATVHDEFAMHVPKGCLDDDTAECEDSGHDYAAHATLQPVSLSTDDSVNAGSVC